VDESVAVPRSYLYVPGNASAKLTGAGRWGADALIFDLEDAVPLAEKEAARRGVAAALETSAAWVRINRNALAEDLAAVVTGGLAGVVVPKAEPAVLDEVDELLAAAERRSGRAPGSVPVMALLETAVGILDAARVASGPRVRRLGLGEADLVGELGLRPGPDRAELAPLRMQVVLASAAAGLPAPTGPVFTDLSPTADVATSTRALLALGFRARTAIHPKHVATINEVFTPTADEVAEARRIVEALGGRGIAVDTTGHMLDSAVVRSAYEVLSRAGEVADA
jgi:citrate lyase subunit beta/citryl-CoA lyase